MQLSFVAPAAIGPGALVVGAIEGAKLLPAAAEADKQAGVKASRIVLLGLGKPEDCDGARIETAAASAIGRLNSTGETEITFEIDVPKGAKLKPAALAAHVGLGARLKTYTFNHYRTKN